jgi:oligopeptidase B
MISRLRLAAVLLSAALIGCSSAPKAPVAERIPTTQTVHGVTLRDDLRWLREKDNPKVIAHLEAENAYTDATMRHLKPLREKLVAEFKSHTKLDDATVPYRKGAWLYSEAYAADAEYPVHYRQPITGGAKQAWLDLPAMSVGHDFIALGEWEPSDDGQRMAYTLDFTGFRDYTLFVRDLTTGKDIEGERIEKVESVAWAADNRTLYYVTSDDAKRPAFLWRKQIGAPAQLVYEEKDRMFNLGVGRTRSGTFIVVGSGSSTTSECWTIDASKPDAPMKSLLGRRDGVEYGADHRPGANGQPGKFYIRTNDTGPNFRLVRVPDNDVKPESFVELLPQRGDVFLEDVNVFKDFIAISQREDALPTLSLLDESTRSLKRLPMPEPIYNTYFGANEVFDATTLRFGYQSMVTPGTVYDYDVKTGKLAVLKREEIPGGYDASQYEMKRIYATATDGTRIPISLCYRKDKGPFPRPILIDAYGAYGIPEWVGFDSNAISLLDRGVSIAVAHIRGGGEGGKPWHLQGRMQTKLNTFTDLVACIEELQKEKLTTRETTAITGASAGGLTMAATINLRPDLVRAALVGVPFVDVMNTMLDESLPLTTQEFVEWGDPIRDEAAFKYMLSYSPYDNVRPQPYPATLVYTSLNDSQVMYWEPTKYTQKLRAATTSKNPVLLWCTMAGGHGGASGRFDQMDETAMQYAFVLWQLGVAK